MKEAIVRANEGKEISVLGDHQVIKLRGKDTGGMVTVIMQDIPPGVGVPPHVHSMEDENFHLIEGQLEFTIDGKIVVLQAGDMIHLPKNVPHAIKNHTQQIARARLSLYPAGIEDMFIALSELPAGPPDLTVVSEICGRYGVNFV